MRMHGLWLVIFLFGAMVSGCATSQKIQAIAAGDNKLTCEQLKQELAKLEESSESVESKKGMTGTNVASFLFWWPGLAYTYYDAGQAEELISERKSHLTNLYNDKDC